ncbi:toprim domain-containing protein [Bacillus spizizenii]|uniref:Toprim domain-containing protein n=1 Tax=Bacillus spizizenii TaxID=96241 RepID=A0A9Q4DLG4_BACSC|nr:toprim domain-containing protein [Bacillus spizizenii]MCY8155202.1 toprim domain-containing protein [Bacillus spizizenii]MCY8313022.1 toprim domain-containing protein [Bacillus spizizenii]MCY8416563.1 toprim domain-containing protein [Bacillus spizizenii]MCY9333638.1 toprim domain-containing protein [Bacillus spizizenii]
MSKRSLEMLENVQLDVWDIIDELRFEYQHSSNFGINPTAFSHKNDTGDWVMSCCPNHAETRASFGISKEPPYHTNCFYCGYLGTLDKTVEIAFGLDDGEGIKLLLSDYILEETRAPIDVDGIINDGRECTTIPFLNESELSKFDNSPSKNKWTYDVAMSYLINQRGITPHTLNTYGIKVDVDNECIVFPQRTRTGELRFLQKRKIGSSYQGAKFINEGSPIKKDILFGLNFINQLRTSKNRIKRVRMVESPLDAMSNYQVGIAAVATNGKILFKNQIRELQLAGVEIVDTFFDNDKAGWDATVQATNALVRAGFIVNQTLYPPQFSRSTKVDSNDLLKLGWLNKLESKPVSLLGYNL